MAPVRKKKQSSIQHLPCFFFCIAFFFYLCYLFINLKQFRFTFGRFCREFPFLFLLLFKLIGLKRNMIFICKLDKDIYKCITQDLITDEVIITEERIGHIIARREQEFYDKYKDSFPEIIENPDYIFPDMKNTALVCKEFKEEGFWINIVVRLAVTADNPLYKNSIITVVKENERRFQQRLRNNKPLYKKE